VNTNWLNLFLHSQTESPVALTHECTMSLYHNSDSHTCYRFGEILPSVLVNHPKMMPYFIQVYNIERYNVRACTFENLFLKQQWQNSLKKWNHRVLMSKKMNVVAQFCKHWRCNLSSQENNTQKKGVLSFQTANRHKLHNLCFGACGSSVGKVMA